MDVRFTSNPRNGEETVIAEMDPLEADELLECLRLLTKTHERFAKESHPVKMLHDGIVSSLSRRLSTPTVEERTEFEVTLPASGTAKVAGVIPDAHIEWAVRVYKVDSFGKPSENESVAKTFKKEERAKAALFFERTQNVHNARVRNHESPAYLVVFGMQDDRKHKKAGSFQELERALCKG